MEKTEKEISWSPQQQDFIDWCEKGHGSCALIAVAGAGKSTTVVEGGIKMKGKTAFMAFNKSAGKELQDKLNAKEVPWHKANAGTAHSFGFAAYRKSFSRVKVDGNKVSHIIDQWKESYTKDDDMVTLIEKHEGKIFQLVSQAKQRALGVIGNITDDKAWYDIVDHFDIFDSEERDAEWIIFAAKEILRRSNKQTDVIDFHDMIYLPLLFRLHFFRFDNVIMDEAQDTNAARRALMRAMLKPGGRAVGVGDPCQAINGFAGADNDAMELIKRDFSMSELPLTVSYRCPKAVVAYAQAWVSHIQSHPDAPAGRVSMCDEVEFYLKTLDGTSAVLCRVTKPLVALAFSLIRRKVPCKIEGRDIGEQIKKVVLRWKVQDTEALLEKLNEYLEKETTKLLAKKQEAKAALVEDMVETIRVIIDQCHIEKKYRIDDVTNYIDQIFADNVEGMLTLSTIHKSKGREWETVYWLNRASTCPSPWARQAWQQEQEKNLCYVAATRAKSELVELSVAIKGEKKGN